VGPWLVRVRTVPEDPIVAVGFGIAKLEGARGALWIGKSTRAATLDTWVALPGSVPGTWDFSAALGERDEYWITQGPDSVRLPFGSRELRWSGRLEVADERVRGTFSGPPEER